MGNLVIFVVGLLDNWLVKVTETFTDILNYYVLQTTANKFTVHEKVCVVQNYLNDQTLKVNKPIPHKFVHLPLQSSYLSLIIQKDEEKKQKSKFCDKHLLFLFQISVGKNEGSLHGRVDFSFGSTWHYHGNISRVRLFIDSWCRQFRLVQGIKVFRTRLNNYGFGKNSVCRDLHLR